MWDLRTCTASAAPEPQPNSIDSLLPIDYHSFRYSEASREFTMTAPSVTRMRVCISAALLLALPASAFAADRPYLAVIEKIAGAVGFFTEDGRQLAQVKVGNFPHEGVLSRDGQF